VIPSRGAHPFYEGAVHYAYRTRTGTVPIPPFQRVETLYLPFTADVGSSEPFETSNIRRYWSRTLAAIVRRDNNDVAYRLHEFLRENCKGLAIGNTTIKTATSSKFIFVDAVVSGQAISEIFDAFDENGLTDCHFLLLVDELGKKLKPKYRRRIEGMRIAQKATIIPVESILTFEWPNYLKPRAKRKTAGLYCHSSSFPEPPSSPKQYTLTDTLLTP